MNDDLEESGALRRPPSKTPSWIMLGFVLGALAVYSLPRPEPKPVAPPVVVTPRPAPPAAPEPPTVEQAVFFEDVFAQLSSSAVWQNDLTEVAFWNASKKAFADCYEVLRVNDKFYFRSIPHLTRPVMKGGVPPDSPLEFTVPDNLRPFVSTPEGKRRLSADGKWVEYLGDKPGVIESTPDQNWMRPPLPEIPASQPTKPTSDKSPVVEIVIPKQMPVELPRPEGK